MPVFQTDVATGEEAQVGAGKDGHPICQLWVTVRGLSFGLCGGIHPCW